MSDSVIRVENLGKKYVINHQASGGYSTLRDKITDGAKSLGRLFTPSRKIDRPTRDEFWALKDVSFEVKQGDRLGIIGRNGAGKSTLLKILSRITEPTAGQISIHGRAASLLEVGTGFHPELTGRENIFLNGAILGMSKDEILKKFDEIVAFSEVERFLDTPVKRYSSGMYVRLAFAVAAHLEPEILIVDEVLAVGDAAFQSKCLGKMGDFSMNGEKTVIFVSHNMQAIRRLCNRCIYLEGGVANTYRSVEDAIQKYFSDSIQTEFDVDLRLLKRVSGLGEKARLLRLRLSPGSKFCYGEPLNLCFTIQCFHNISNLAIGIGFETIDGNRVMTLDSDHDGEAISLESGIHEIQFSLDTNPLHPGPYKISAAILSGVHDLDFISFPIIWEVQSGSNDLVSDRGFGGCRLLADVSIMSNTNYVS